MTGFNIRIGRFLPKDENIVILPVDAGMFMGVRERFEDVPAILRELHNFDVVMLSPGMLERCASTFARRGAPASVVRINWNSNYCFQWGYEQGNTTLSLTPEEAVILGADAAVASLAVATGDPAVDAANVEVFTRIMAEKRKAGLPVGGEVYPVGSNKPGTPEFNEIVSSTCRMVAELGADFAKTFYTDDASFARLVAAVPIPLLVLGAEKMPREIDALTLAEKAVRAGARGIVFGRNVMLARSPQRMLDALNDVVKRGVDARTAASKCGIEY